MHYVDRQFVCDRLRVSRRTSYDLVRPGRIALVSTDDVITLLNRTSVGRQERLDHVPSDLVTADELAAATGVPARLVKRYAKRTCDPLPSYRINKQVVRYRRSVAETWLAAMTRPRRYR